MRGRAVGIISQCILVLLTSSDLYTCLLCLRWQCQRAGKDGQRVGHARVRDGSRFVWSWWALKRSHWKADLICCAALDLHGGASDFFAQLAAARKRICKRHCERNVNVTLVAAMRRPVAFGIEAKFVRCASFCGERAQLSPRRFAVSFR